MTHQYRSLPAASVIVEQAIAAAAPYDAIVIVEDRFEADVRFANNTSTTNGVRRDRRVAIAVIIDRSGGMAVGVVSRSGEFDVSGLVDDARAQALASDPAPDAAPLIASPYASSDFLDAPQETGLSLFRSVLVDLGEAFKEAQAKNEILAGFATHEMTTTYLGTSTGIRYRHVQPTGSFEFVARTTDGESSAWIGVGTEDFTDVSVPTIYERLSSRLAQSSRKISLPAGRYEVLLPPDATADLVVELWSAMSGRDAEDGGNVFSSTPGKTRIDERLVKLPFSLSSDPLADQMACADHLVTSSSSTDVSLFDNGAPLSRTEWIDDGVLKRLRYHRAGALRSGQQFTPPIDNVTLSLPGATKSLDDLIATTTRGLLLTCLWYIREVDPATLLLTGLTRDGVYLVEDGEVVGAVNNFRFNESPLDMLGRVLEAGETKRALSREWHEWMNRTAMPALRVADFNMSSVSQAN